MPEKYSPGRPSSPEDQAPQVKEELDQDLITHQGQYRTGAIHPKGKHGGGHLGALEDENVPVVPPMSGPADLLGENYENAQGNESGDTEVGEENFDPRDELTPG